MSAGSINLAETAVCTIASGHYAQTVYNGLGCVGISVEPHFNPDEVHGEILDLSEKYELYGLCDEGAIIINDKNTEFYGKVYFVSKRNVTQISGI